MANAVVSYKEVEVITTSKEPVYTLTLTEAEAEALRALTGRTGGDGKYRSATGSVFGALNAVGVDSVATGHLEGSVTFKKNPTVVKW